MLCVWCVFLFFCVFTGRLIIMFSSGWQWWINVFSIDTELRKKKTKKMRIMRRKNWIFFLMIFGWWDYFWLGKYQSLLRAGFKYSSHGHYLFIIHIELLHCSMAIWANGEGFVSNLRRFIVSSKDNIAMTFYCGEMLFIYLLISITIAGTLYKAQEKHVLVVGESHFWKNLLKIWFHKISSKR